MGAFRNERTAIVTNRITRITLLALAAVTAACWGEVKDIFPADGGGGGSDAPSDPVFYPGGGVGGGPLDGQLNLYLIDQVTGAPIAGARVMVGDAPETALLGETDADGLVVFLDAALAGSADVHAFADGYVLESTLALAWTDATLLLEPLAAPAATGTAALSGTVTGFEALPDPTITQFRVVRVYYGEALASLLTFRGADFDRRPYDYVELRPDLEGGDFAMAVPARRGAAFAVAGVVETAGTGDETDDTTDWSLLGAITGLEPEPDGAIGGLEIALDTALTAEVGVEMLNLPQSFPLRDVYLGFDLGAGGTVWLVPERVDTFFSFHAPFPAGAWADAGPVLVGAATQLDPGPDAGPFDELPRSFVFERGFTMWIGYNETPWYMGTPPPPPGSLSWSEGAFGCLPTTGRSLSQLVVSGAASGEALWRVTAWGDLPDSLPYPALPPDWAAPALPTDGVSIEVFVDSLVEGTSEMRFDDFSKLATGRVLDGALFQ
jgi:hypothetical protein